MWEQEAGADKCGAEGGICEQQVAAGGCGEGKGEEEPRCGRGGGAGVVGVDRGWQFCAKYALIGADAAQFAVRRGAVKVGADAIKQSAARAALQEVEALACRERERAGEQIEGVLGFNGRVILADYLPCAAVKPLA